MKIKIVLCTRIKVSRNSERKSAFFLIEIFIFGLHYPFNYIRAKVQNDHEIILKLL